MDYHYKMADNKKVYTCTRCGYFSSVKCNVIAHLKKGTPCEPKVRNIPREDVLKLFDKQEPSTETVSCPFCNKRIVKSNISRHKKICKSSNHIVTGKITIEENNTIINDDTLEKNNAFVDNKLQQTIDEQRQLIQFLTQENRLLKSKIVQVSFNITNNHNQVVKYKKKNIPHAVKVKCWNTHVGELVPKINCLCCDNVSITQHNFHCGHIIAETHGGTLDINNLLPICNVCNSSMGSMNMNEFKTMYGFSNTYL